MLSLLVSRAATAGAGSFLRRGRSVRNFAWASWSDAGDGSHQADPGSWRAVDWTFASGRCAGHEVPRTEAAEESGLPGVRDASDRHAADRLQRVLRHSWGGKVCE